MVERRIPGINLAQRLSGRGPATNAQLLEYILLAIGELKRLIRFPRGAGELLAGNPVRFPSWSGFLVRRAALELRKGSAALEAAGCDVNAAWEKFEALVQSTGMERRSLVRGGLHPGSLPSGVD